VNSISEIKFIKRRSNSIIVSFLILIIFDILIFLFLKHPIRRYHIRSISVPENISNVVLICINIIIICGIKFSYFKSNYKTISKHSDKFIISHREEMTEILFKDIMNVDFIYDIKGNDLHNVIIREQNNETILDFSELEFSNNSELIKYFESEIEILAEKYSFKRENKFY